MMRRRRRAPYTIIIITLCFVAVGVIGFYIGSRVNLARNEDNKSIVADEDERRSEIEQPQPGTIDTDPADDTTPVNIVENSVSPETKIIFRSHYTKCQTIKDEPMSATEDMVGLKEDAFKTYAAELYPEWQIVRFSNEEVILFQRKDQICPDHFFVSELDGYIVVFKYTETGQRYVVEKTDIPVAHLPEIDQEKIRRGILIRNRSEVNQLLEDYSS